MSDLDDLGQKLKGKAQQIKGDFNEERGQGIKGGIQKLKGKVNEPSQMPSSRQNITGDVTQAIGKR